MKEAASQKKSKKFTRLILVMWRGAMGHKQPHRQRHCSAPVSGSRLLSSHPQDCAHQSSEMSTMIYRRCAVSAGEESCHPVRRTVECPLPVSVARNRASSPSSPEKWVGIEKNIPGSPEKRLQLCSQQPVLPCGICCVVLFVCRRREVATGRVVGESGVGSRKLMTSP